MNKVSDIVGIVLAGGWGFLTEGRSKLVERVNGRAMVAYPVHLLHDELKLPKTLVVINPRYHLPIFEALDDYDRSHYVMQDSRTGTAGGVYLCLPNLGNAKTVVVLYGDMPFWKMSSIYALISEHIRKRAVLSMFSIDLSGPYGEHVKSFGRILRDSHGRILKACEPWQMTEADLSIATTVNPSAWVFNRKWLQDNIEHLPPHDKGDGFGHEYWLPDLVERAVTQGQTIAEVPLQDAREAFGINTALELETARQLYVEQHGDTR